MRVGSFFRRLRWLPEVWEAASGCETSDWSSFVRAGGGLWSQEDSSNVSVIMLK